MRKMARHLILALLACVTLAGCGGDKDPQTPDPGTPLPSGDIQVSGNERIGWRQLAADTGELGLLQFIAYVDGARTPLNGATCGTTPTADGFDCSAPLPSLTTGRHTLELAAVLTGPSGEVESERSGPLTVVMTGTRTSASASVSILTADGLPLELARLADGLQNPSDIAFDPDGNIFVAERGGVVRAMRDGALLPDAALDLSGDVVAPRGGLLAMALDPDFAETGFIYVLYAVDAPRNGLEFMLGRFRGVDGRFAERAVLLDRVAADPDGASGALRIGADGKLYVALDNAADAAAPASFSSYNGKVLRLNVDATTPDDRGGVSPIFSFDHPQPKALDWQPGSDELWVVDSAAASGGRLRRAASRTGYTLPEGTGASAATFYRGALVPAFRGNLFIAAEAGRQLMRLQFDPADATRVTKVETLLKDEIGPVRVVAEGNDGALYIASDTALYRLAP